MVSGFNHCESLATTIEDRKKEGCFTKVYIILNIHKILYLINFALILIKLLVISKLNCQLGISIYPDHNSSWTN